MQRSRFDEAAAARAELEANQVRELQVLFANLRDQVAVLNKLASQHRIEEIRRIEDVVPLLLPHTAFKSYPLSLLDQGRFDRLNQWLGMLTSRDLSWVDCSGIRSLDEWIEALDANTDVRVVHSFGTTGKLSLIPRTQAEWDAGAYFVAGCIKDWHGSGIDLLRERRPVIQPGHRFGANGATRVANTVVPLFAGSESESLFLYPNDRFSADVALLAGRLKGAEPAVALPAGLRERWAAFKERERQRPQQLQRFFDEMVGKFGGLDIYLCAVWPVVYDWAMEGLKAGLRGVFGAHSIFHTGGGMKNRQTPPDLRERVFEFLGVDTCYEFYGMTEIISACPRCAVGNYHVPPVLVPFVLDPATGNPLPRIGRQTGRFAAVDLLARTYWCGVITGDEVTVGGWDRPCACGRFGPYVEPTIRRYRADEGGDDKVNCGGTPSAYDEALEYLAAQVQ